jgi:hypothetical protein
MKEKNRKMKSSTKWSVVYSGSKIKRKKLKMHTLAWGKSFD